MSSLSYFFKRMQVMIIVMALFTSIPALGGDGDFLWPPGIEIERPQIVVSDGHGGVIIVWEGGGVPSQIRAQRYDSQANALWGSGGKLVSDSNSINAQRPAATKDMFGGIVVTWQAGSDLYVQRLDSSGGKLWNGGGAVKILSAVNPTENPIITPDGAGGAYVGYRRKINQVTKNGSVSNTTGYEFVMSEGVERFTMVYDGTAGYSPTWEMLPGGVFLVWFSSSTMNIHAQHIKGGARWGDTVNFYGTVVATDYTHVSISHNRLYQAITDGSGGLIVAWSGWEGSPLDFGGQVRAQRLDGNGNRLWSDSGTVVVDSSQVGGDSLIWWNQLLPPKLVSDGDNGAILAWTDMRNTHNYPGDLDIYTQRIGENGTVMWQANGVWVTWPGDTTGQIPVNSGTEKNPALAKDGYGGAVIAVQDYYQSQNLFVNRISGQGKTLWTHWLIWDDYAGGNGEQSWPHIVFDGTGPGPKGAVVAWKSSGGQVGDSFQKVEISEEPPENDDIETASLLGFPGSETLHGATNDGESSCGSATQQPDVWYLFTAPSSGILTVDTCGSHDLFGAGTGLDAVLSLHGGLSGTIADQLVCNDDDPDLICSGLSTKSGVVRDSRVNYFMAAGQTVYMRVSRYDENTDGSFNLNHTFVPKTMGDTDGDGDVDGRDVAHLADWFDAVCGDGCSSDFDLSGYVDAKDLLLQSANFGNTP